MLEKQNSEFEIKLGFIFPINKILNIASQSKLEKNLWIYHKLRTSLCALKKLRILTKL